MPFVNPVPALPYMEPAQALPRVMRMLEGMARPDHARLRFVRIIEQTPPATPPGFPNQRIAFITYELDLGIPPRVKRYTALAHIITMPGPQIWTYYSSQVYAPSPVFGRRLPELLRIWNSWKVSDAWRNQRLQEALATMRETGEMMHASWQRRQRMLDNVHADWIEVIRGERYVRDTATGELGTAPLWKVDRIVEKLNESEGYRRFEEVPLRDFNR